MQDFLCNFTTVCSDLPLNIFLYIKERNDIFEQNCTLLFHILSSDLNSAVHEIHGPRSARYKVIWTCRRTQGKVVTHELVWWPYDDIQGYYTGKPLGGIPWSTWSMGFYGSSQVVYFRCPLIDTIHSWVSSTVNLALEGSPKTRTYEGLT